MMNSLSLEEEKINKNIRNLFRLVKKAKLIRDRILGDNENLFEHEEEKNYYKPVKVSNFCVTMVIEKKTISVEEYLNNIRPYLKDIINNIKKSDTWKV